MQINSTKIITMGSCKVFNLATARKNAIKLFVAYLRELRK